MNERSDGQQNRDELYANEDLLLTQFAVDHASDEVYWIDENARFVYVNETACRSLEYTREELLRLTVPDIDPTWPMGKWQAQWETLKQQQSSTFETVHKTKQGRIFPVEIKANFIEYRGRSLDCAYARDITERKRSEEVLRFTQFAVDNMSDAAVYIAPDARFIYVNKAATQLLGYTKDELLGMSVFDVNQAFTPEMWPTHWEHVRQKRAITMEGFVKAKDRSTIPVEIRVNLVEFEGTEFHYTFVRDISERKAAEAERRALEQCLEENKRKFYRETVLSVTSGKLDICETRDVKAYISSAQTKIDVRDASDVGMVRTEIDAFMSGHGLNEADLAAYMIGVGEAITNALKHGNGGRVYVGKMDNCVWVGVRDRGPGIASLILPRAVLWRGFSTKPSLGMGYWIMLEVADRILLKTGTHGTTVVLIKSLTPASCDTTFGLAECPTDLA